MRPYGPLVFVVSLLCDKKFFLRADHHGVPCIFLVHGSIT